MHDWQWEYFSSFSDVLKALDIDQNDLREFISVATSSKEINEDLIYCIFDMICEKMLNWIKPYEQKLVFKPYRIFYVCSRKVNTFLASKKNFYSRIRDILSMWNTFQNHFNRSSHNVTKANALLLNSLEGVTQWKHVYNRYLHCDQNICMRFSKFVQKHKFIKINEVEYYGVQCE